MPSLPTHWRRIHRDHGPDTEHVATPQTIANVLKSMNEAGDLHPFRVEFRYADGSKVIAAPKNWRAA